MTNNERDERENKPVTEESVDPKVETPDPNPNDVQLPPKVDDGLGRAIGHSIERAGH